MINNNISQATYLTHFIFKIDEKEYLPVYFLSQKNVHRQQWAHSLKRFFHFKRIVLLR